LYSADLETTEGISLLSLKNHLLLSYIQSLSLLTAHRVLGHSLTLRSRPSQPFTAAARDARGSAAGDLVDALVEDRIILEKVKQLESKMRYQIEKLVRISQDDAARTEADIVNGRLNVEYMHGNIFKPICVDPLSFRPNPENLVNKAESESEDNEEEGAANEHGGGIYRPPKLAPMPYIEKKDKSKRRPPVPTGLAALSHLDVSIPHVESTSGLGSMPSMASSRARELARMNEFEEENMSRLVMTKKEARRRARDEEDVALGGTGVSRGRRRGGGLEDEFRDVLRAVDRSGHQGGMDDGYEALRVKGRKQDAFSRSKTRPREDDDDGHGRVRKKGRFQKAVKTMARKQRRD
jgi:U3 small nucleolar ribonucleoprotein protein LCP5